MKKVALCVALALGVAARLSFPQAPEGRAAKSQLQVERWDGQHWKKADIKSVFDHNDRIRFRYRSTAAGSLYVLDHTSGGQTAWMYPMAQQQQTALVPDTEIVIPGGDGAYKVTGPPGIDTLYWIEVPQPVNLPDAQEVHIPSTLISRCGEQAEIDTQEACLHDNAGPKPLKDPQQLLSILHVEGTLAARDLSFESKPGGTDIQSAAAGPSVGLVYEVRIAHR